jgi:prophage regulatory protein
MQQTFGVLVMETTVRILRLPDVEAKSGLKRDSIYRGAREGWFPRPVKISQGASGWVESEINDYIAKRVAERDAAL